MTLLANAPTEVLALPANATDNPTVSQKVSSWTVQKTVAIVVGIAILFAVALFLVGTFSYIGYLGHEAMTLPPITNTVPTPTTQTPAAIAKLETLLNAKEGEAKTLAAQTKTTLQSPAAQADAAKAKALLESGIAEIKSELNALSQQQ